jgi:hypothetical protein
LLQSLQELLLDALIQLRGSQCLGLALLLAAFDLGKEERREGGREGGRNSERS